MRIHNQSGGKFIIVVIPWIQNKETPDLLIKALSFNHTYNFSFFVNVFISYVPAQI